MPGKKIVFAEINYYHHQDFTHPDQAILKHQPSNLFAEPFSEFAKIHLIKHLDFEGQLHRKNISYHFFKRKNNTFQIPFATHRFIAGLKPDLVLVQGFVFPLQVMHLRKKLGRSAKILLQYHKESPTQKKRFLQKLADRYVDGYLFASLGSADEWIKAGIIKSIEKCFELPQTSTEFTKQEKEKSRQLTKMTANTNFLWVARLDQNKDPLTVLKAFEKYIHQEKNVQLWMIYSQQEIEEEVKNFISQNQNLISQVKMVGTIENNQMPYWYSAADYFILSSWKEGGSYALTEAMACGCIPIVSNIPPSLKAIDHGKAGLIFDCGDPESLYKIFASLRFINAQQLSDIARKQFENYQSPRAVAEQLKTIYQLVSLK